MKKPRKRKRPNSSSEEDDPVDTSVESAEETNDEDEEDEGEDDEGEDDEDDEDDDEGDDFGSDSDRPLSERVMKANKWVIVAIVSERVIVDQSSAERQYILSRRGVDVDRTDWRNADAQTDVPPTVMADWRAQHPLSQVKFYWLGYKDADKKTIKTQFKAHVAGDGDWLSWKTKFNASRKG